MALKARAHESNLRVGNADTRPDVLVDHPINFLPVIESYKKHGRLTLRLEHLPSKARFSAGARAGEKSWSLAAEDLPDLKYQLLEGTTADHSITIRVIGIERGDTLAVLSQNVREILGSTVALGGRASGNDQDTQQLKEQLSSTQNALDSLQAQLAEAEERLNSAKATWLAAETEKLSKAQQDWQANEANRVQELNRQWEGKLQKQTVLAHAEVLQQEQTRNAAALQAAKAEWNEEASRQLATAKLAWQQEETSRTDALRRQMELQIGEAKANQTAPSAGHPTGDRDGELNAAKVAWKAEEDRRLLEAQRSWQAREAAAIEQLNQKWEAKLQEAVAAQLSHTTGHQNTSGDAAVKELRDTLSTLQLVIVERDNALQRLTKGLEAERTARAHEVEVLRSEYENALRHERDRQNELLRAHELSRSEWERKTAHDIKRITARAEAAEIGLASQRVSASDNVRLENEISMLRASLAGRDQDLQREHKKLLNTTDALHNCEEQEPSKNAGKGVAIRIRPYARDVLVGVVCTVAAILLLPQFMQASAPATDQASIQPIPPVPVQTLLPTSVVVRTTRLRTGPAKTERSIVRVERGAEVSVLEVQPIWTRIKMNYKTKAVEGWVETDRLDLAESHAVSESKPSR
ncbi:MAG: hypothetical protein ABL973_17885 [Micropepsaceae bacterium]